MITTFTVLLVAATLSVTATLRDGSRVMGDTSLETLALRVGGGMVTNVALQHVRTVQTSDDGAWQLVQLGHGNPLRGRVSASEFVMNSGLGEVRLPWSILEELRVQAPTGDVTWLTATGAPGVLLARGGEIVLTGGATWTREKFKSPLAVDCEVLLEKRVNNGSGWLEIALVTESSRRTTTDRPCSARLVYGVRTAQGSQDGIILRQMHTAQNTTRQKGVAPFYLAPGAWHRLRFEVLGDVMRLELNGRVYKLNGVQTPGLATAVQLSSGESDTRWRVRNFQIR